MQKPIKFIYALLIITLVGAGVTFGLQSKVNQIYESQLKNTSTVQDVSKSEVSFLPSWPIEGVYAMESDASLEGEITNKDCGLTISLSKSAGDYNYNLKTTKRNVNGKINLLTNDGKTYITFEGIPWDEYRGDVTQDENKEAFESPVGIDGLFSENEITIQNYGNAMNSYTKLGECSGKYIHLVNMNTYMLNTSDIIGNWQVVSGGVADEIAFSVEDGQNMYSEYNYNPILQMTKLDTSCSGWTIDKNNNITITGCSTGRSVWHIQKLTPTELQFYDLSDESHELSSYKKFKE